MTDRNGIEIDYCPECSGVWLDRGELDKIIEVKSITTEIMIIVIKRRRDFWESFLTFKY